jgi:uncharacterized membrane protein YoaK (UPF0700 family)
MASPPLVATHRPEHNGRRGGRHWVSRVRRPVHGPYHGQLSRGGRARCHGGFGQAGPILAVPVFIAVLAIVVVLFGGIGNDGKRRRSLLILHVALLGGCLALGLRFGPFSNADSPVAVLAGMLAVAAMATQNALVKLALVESPSTAVMTTNTTQLIVDLAALVRSAKAVDKLDKTRRRARVTFLCMAGFVGGCVGGAVLELRFGAGALALPVILAALAIPLGELKGRSYEQFY